MHQPLRPGEATWRQNLAQRLYRRVIHRPGLAGSSQRMPYDLRVWGVVVQLFYVCRAWERSFRVGPLAVDGLAVRGVAG